MYRVWGEEKDTSGMPEIPAPPYQKLYSGYRYAGDVAPKTASMDYHGRPIDPKMTSSLHDGEPEVTVCNTGLRVSQIAPHVPEQAPFSTSRRRRRAELEAKKRQEMRKLKPIPMPMKDTRSAQNTSYISKQIKHARGLN